MGYRYRLHRQDLPGKPDLAFVARRKIIMIHGCFWHAHEGCRGARLPKSRLDYWQPKLSGNRERDAAVNAALLADRWQVMIVWECETKDPDLRRRIERFLGPRRCS